MGYEKREVRNGLVTILGIIYVNPANSLALHRKNLLLASVQLELYQKLKTDLWYQSGKIMKLLCSVLERQ